MGWQNASHIELVYEDTEDKNAEILYKKGIITGVKGEAGYYYKPNNNIKRSEVSAIVHRLYKYDPLAIKPVTGVAEGLLVSNPTTERHFEKVLIYMGMNNLTELKITYTTAPSQYTYEEREGICKNVLAAQNALFEEYHEYFCYVNTLKVATSTENGKMILTISAVNDTFSEEEIKTMRAEFFKTATASLEEIIAEGLITSEMTDMQKAQVVFEWVCQNCQYDNSFNTESYFGYGAAVKGKAVCQGYTALYNTMCKQLGIWCEGLSGTAKTGNKTESHIWTVANIDGKDVHIDVTFGDTGKKAGEICSYDYFCKDSEVFKKTHTWQ